MRHCAVELPHLGNSDTSTRVSFTLHPMGGVVLRGLAEDQIHAAVTGAADLFHAIPLPAKQVGDGLLKLARCKPVKIIGGVNAVESSGMRVRVPFLSQKSQKADSGREDSQRPKWYCHQFAR